MVVSPWGSNQDLSASEPGGQTLYGLYVAGAKKALLSSFKHLAGEFSAFVVGLFVGHAGSLASDSPHARNLKEALV